MNDKLVLVLSILLTLAFLGAGGMKLANADEAAKNFAHFGYGSWFAVFIGVCEVAGAIGLQIRRLSGLAALGLACIMAGAVVSHAMNDPIADAIPAAVLLGLCLVVSKARWPSLLVKEAPSAAP